MSVTERNRYSHEIPQRSNKFLKSIMGSTSLFHRQYDRIPEQHITAFSVDTSAKIPETSTIRSPEVKRDRMASLMSVPSHKPVAPKFDAT